MRKPLIVVYGATLVFGTPELQLSVRPSQTSFISKATFGLNCGHCIEDHRHFIQRLL